MSSPEAAAAVAATASSSACEESSETSSSSGCSAAEERNAPSSVAATSSSKENTAEDAVVANDVWKKESSTGLSSVRDARSWTIPDWLVARQEVGLHRCAALRCRHSRISTASLAYKIAWNSSRMRNMILAVGPGTPASILWKSGANRVQRTRHQNREQEMSDDGGDDEEGAEDDAGNHDADHHATENNGGNDDSDERSHNSNSNNNNMEEEKDSDDSSEDTDGMMASATTNAGHRWSGHESHDTEVVMHDDDGNRTRMVRGVIIGAAQLSNEEQMPLREIAESFVRDFMREHGDRMFRGDQVREQGENSSNDNDQDDDVEEDGNNNEDDDEEEELIAQGRPWPHPRGLGWDHTSHVQPSIRHGGCINTACWMDSPWKLAARDGSSIGANSLFGAITVHDCPTQLLTSGDDRLVKIWDVQDAMGTISPLDGGWDTFTPLAKHVKPYMPATQKIWKSYYRKRPCSRLPGSVVHLATIVTGHRGNVFHATPVHHQAGKVLTCGADGMLRLSDANTETSSVVMMFGDTSTFIFHSSMAFSHVFLTANTGLLCSEEGLHRFDLRLSRREQQRRSLLSGVGGCFSSDYCKSCAIWNPHVQISKTVAVGSDSAVESNYVFAGGRSETVGLVDLRVTGSNSRLVETYRPRDLYMTKNVSVSGIDVSKNGREVLVSYESDQIYTFPILRDCSSRAGPTLEEIDSHAECSNNPVSELASYGGHLNRFTFLKNAKYAGPKDEYICSGCDSGCGWIFERKTGAVVSLLGADRCTCNGLIPHPTLPFFITYGIDSTAKIWRATPPISRYADDSPQGRASAFLDNESDFEISQTTRSWKITRHIVERNASPGMLPDFVATPEEIASGSRFSPTTRTAIGGTLSPMIGNALRLLPTLLRRHRHECYRSSQRSNSSRGPVDTPIEHPVEAFSQRVSMSRLRLQAQRLGAIWEPRRPWAFDCSHYVHPADLVPDNPSDWILLDSTMSGSRCKHLSFNEDHVEILRETFEGSFTLFETSRENLMPPWLLDSTLPKCDEVVRNEWVLTEEANETILRSRAFLCATISLLKNGGNEAMKDGMIFSAARRYDKAIQYCAFVFMNHEQGKSSLKHLVCKDPSSYSIDEATDGETYLHSVTPKWTPLLNLLVTTRLNLSLLLLKPRFCDASQAAEQAKAALDYLRPFLTRPDDIDSTILSLHSKAQFRLGSAELKLGNYSKAIEHLDGSLKGSKGAVGKPDPLVERRLNEAKRKLKSKKKRDRERYERAFRQIDQSMDST